MDWANEQGGIERKCPHIGDVVRYRSVMGDERSYRALLRTPGVARAFGASTFSRMGDGMFGVVLVLFVLDQFGSPTLAGLAAFCAFAPGLVLGPFAGVLLDRYGPSRPMLLDYAVSALVVGLIAGLALVGALSPATVLVLAAAYSATSSLGSAGIRTLLPEIVPERLWDRANAADTGGFAVTDAAGPALAGALFAVLGGVGALFATAAAFAGAALTLVRPVGRASPAKGTARASVVRQAWEGLRYVVANRTLRGLAVSYSLYQVAFGVLVVALPVLVLGRLSGGEFAVGALWGVLGAAGVVSGFVSGWLGTEGRERHLIAGGMLLSALALLALPFAGSLVAAFVCVCALGVVGSPVDVALLSLRQRKTNRAKLGRVLAISMSLNLTGFPLGSVISGPLISASLALGLTFAAAACVLAAVLAFVAIE